jgi:HPt (histidine-containing phosphotransfer) domain-containing protein
MGDVSGSTMRPTKPLHALVADGHELCQAVARRLLERQGHAVTVARDGAATINLFGAMRFDVVLLQAELRDIAPADVARVIRTLERERDLEPALVIVMSDEGPARESHDWDPADIDGVVARPLRSLDLAAALQRGPRLRTHESPTTAFDLGQALRRAGGSEEILRTAGSACIDSMPRQVESVEQALAARDLATLGRAAHRVKGMVSNFGAESAAAAARRLQQAAQEGDLAGAAREWMELRRHLDELVAALSGMTTGASR